MLDGTNDEKMMAYAVRLTSRGAYTFRQVMRKLLAKGASSESAGKICARLVDSGMIDDARYCELFVSTHPDLGFARLRVELLKRGIDRDLVRDLLVLDTEAETARALSLAIEWSAFADSRKIGERLLRRGFSSSVVNEAVRRACDESS
jgi:SOS response regulatory protein OraA/RecX